MPTSEYVRSLRSRVGHDVLLLPAVTAVIRDGDRFLLARQRDTGRWSLVGGGIEPGEEPADATWVSTAGLAGLDHHDWIDRVLRDVTSPAVPVRRQRL